MLTTRGCVALSAVDALSCRHLNLQGAVAIVPARRIHRNRDQPFAYIVERATIWSEFTSVLRLLRNQVTDTRRLHFFYILVLQMPSLIWPPLLYLLYNSQL